MFKRGAIWFLSIAVLAPSFFGVTAILASGNDERVGGHAGWRPDVVLIVTDDQRWDTLSRMPGVSRVLEAEGVTFRNAFVTNPLVARLDRRSSPAPIRTRRASTRTGGTTASGPSTTIDGRHVARRRRLRTALIGKYFNGSWPITYVPPGWDRWVAFRDANDLYYDFDL